MVKEWLKVSSGIMQGWRLEIVMRFHFAPRGAAFLGLGLLRGHGQTKILSTMGANHFWKYKILIILQLLL